MLRFATATEVRVTAGGDETHQPRPPSTCSVVICAYTDERLGLLLDAVASVQRQTVDAEVVVVIDGNPDLEATLATQLSGVTVVANGGVRGLSGARNTGIDTTTGDLVAFLDDDAAADERWLEHLASCFDDPAVMAAGGTIVPRWAESRPRWFPAEFDWVIGCTYRGQVGFEPGVETPTPIRNVIGANMMMRRSVLHAVGGFHTELGRVGNDPVGGEETDLCIRIAQRFGGGSVVAAPRAVVWHHVPSSRGTWRYFHRRCHAEGRTKAVLARVRGSRDGLSSETRYLTRTLPRAVASYLGTALRGDVGGLTSAAATISGTGMTGLGWIEGSLRRGSLYAGERA